MKSGELVHLLGDVALFSCSSILMQNTLGHSLVDGLDGCGISATGLFLITADNSSFELFDGGLQSGLLLLVLFVGLAGKKNSLLSRLNVGHRYTSSNSVCTMSADGVSLMQKHIIAERFDKINRKFIFLEKFLH